MISDRTFNKTLNNISNYLINELKKEVKESIRNSIIAKINSFNEQSQLIIDNIQIMLNQVITKELLEDMETLVELINNYTLLVENQNNRYNFIMGENPFNLLNIFIYEKLEPPLLLIYDKYNSIEEQLLQRIQALAEEFPDCYSIIKNKLLGNKIELIDLLTNQINSTLIDYQNELINDIKSYINKLIHFTYIDGLQTMEYSCENSDCGIPINNFRRLDKEESSNITRVYKGHSFIINKSKLENRINKNVNFQNKRRTASLPEYTPNMGALSEDDIIYYLSDIQNTTLKLNKSLFSWDYSNVNLTSNKFLTKINFTYLEKLRLTFDIKLVKFSTILTENSIQKLKDIILKQFYLIEEYVHKSSDLVQNKTNNFLNELNKTSEFIESLSGYIHNQALGYYKILHTIIQNKYENLNGKRIRLLKEINIKDYSKETNKTKIALLSTISLFQSEISFNLNFTHIINKCFGHLFNLSKFNDFMDKYSKIGKSYSKSISIPFPGFPYFQILFNISCYAGLGFFAGIEPDWNWAKIEFNLGLDVYAEAKVPYQLEAGLYFPSAKSPIQIALVIGLEGVICHGRAGIKLEITLNDGETMVDCYFILNALVFEFYFQIRITIDFSPWFQAGYKFDIYRVELFGLHVEFHSNSKKQRESFKENQIGGLNSPIGIGFSPESGD